MPIRVDTPDVVGPMLGCVPSSSGEIEAADEGDGVIDYDDFRMMRGANRVIAVHVKMEPWVSRPTGTEERQHFTIEGEDHREIPNQDNQDMDVQIRPARSQIVEIGPQIRKTFSFAVSEPQVNTAVEIPTPDQNGFLREFESIRHGGKVSRTVDQEFDTRGVSDFPTIATCLQNCHQ